LANLLVRHKLGSLVSSNRQAPPRVGKIDGTVYVRDSRNNIYKWNGTNKSFDKVDNVTATNIAVDGNGRPWIAFDTTPTIKRGKD